MKPRESKESQKSKVLLRSQLCEPTNRVNKETQGMRSAWASCGLFLEPRVRR